MKAVAPLIKNAAVNKLERIIFLDQEFISGVEYIWMSETISDATATMGFPNGSQSARSLTPWVGDPWTEALSRKHSVANAVSLTYERGTVRHMRPTDWKLWYPMVW